MNMKQGGSQKDIVSICLFHSVAKTDKDSQWRAVRDSMNVCLVCIVATISSHQNDA